MNEDPRPAEIAYVISLNGYCNNHCRICVCGPQGRTRRGFAELLADARAARPFFDGFILTDGEPALIDDLPALLRGLKELSPRILQIHTNARMLMYANYADRLLAVQGVDYVVRLYSSDPAIHDDITGVEGSCVQTIKGAHRISEAPGVGLFVEIPVTRLNYDDLPQTMEAGRWLGAQGIFISGGFPAAGELNLPEEDASALAQYRKHIDLMGMSGEDFGRVIVTYATEDRFVQPSLESFRSDKSGLTVRGSDTNNPFVFRKSRDRSLRTRFLFMPFSGSEQSEASAVPPASAAGMAGFAGLLGYPSEIIDLDRRGKTRRGAGVEGISGEGHGGMTESSLSHGRAEVTMAKLVESSELSGNAVIWICSRYESFHAFDVFTHGNLARALGEIVKKATTGALLAFEHIAQAPGEMFEGLADYVFRNPRFAAYSVVGLLNMIEFGDRSPVAVFGNAAVPNVSDVELDIALLPPPDFSGLDMRDYLVPMPRALKTFMDEEIPAFDADNRIGFIPFYISRGCRFECAFCGRPGHFQAMDPVRAAKILAETARATGLTNVDLADRAINVDEGFLGAFCDALIQEGTPFLWKATARPCFRNAGLLKKMRGAGCVMLNFAVESGSDRVLKNMKKGFTSSESQEALSLATQAGIVTSINLLSGFPHEQPEDLEATIDFIVRNRESIDFVLSHSSFSWQEPLRTDPAQLGIRLRPIPGENCFGGFYPYDEIEGRSWEDIVDFKRQGYVRLERITKDLLAFSSPGGDFAVFHLFSMGFDRPVVRRFLESYRKLVIKYTDAPAAGSFDEQAERVFMSRFRFNDVSRTPSMQSGLTLKESPDTAKCSI